MGHLVNWAVTTKTMVYEMNKHTTVVSGSRGDRSLIRAHEVFFFKQRFLYTGRSCVRFNLKRKSFSQRTGEGCGTFISQNNIIIQQKL